MSPIQVQKKFAFTGHRDCLYALSATGAEQSFLSAGADGLVVQWDFTQPDQGKVLAKMQSTVYAMTYDEASGFVFIGQNFDGIHAVHLTDASKNFSIACTQAAIFDVWVQGDFLWLATGDGELIYIHWTEKRIVQRVKLSDKSLRSLHYHPEQEVLAVGASNHQIHLFDLKSKKVVQVLEGHTNSVFTVQYSPDFQFLMSAGRDAHLKIWDVKNDYRLKEDIVAHMYAINHITFSPSGRYFATASMDKSIKLWDARSFALLKVIDKARHAGHGTSVNKLLWTSTDNLLVSCSDDRTISIWDLTLQ
ncbi:cytochrome D1 domain-containing protein [Cytophagales bacterium LB-30]|uniref:Cytochrome D1 domain-containing protein n=1 Tax=Shiella aurantiaca TaxID=3058365 RepID=A0ABT8F8E2_9BACT|nr:cytochrome D1 domain-containing protein [Shiella aurantiaca]MDN4166514.1 cytochrome D1 domain-containing protein [Shiella aurantiaca]